MCRRLISILAIFAFLSMGVVTETLAQQANPCAAKGTNPCAAKPANPCAAKNPCAPKK